MKRNLISLLVIVFTILIQSVVLSNFTVFGGKVDLVLVVVIVWGLSRGQNDGVVIGFILGIIQDVFSSGIYINSISKMAAGFIAGNLKTKIFGREQLLATGIIFLGTIVSLFLDFFIIVVFLNGKPSFSLVGILVSAVLNGIVAYVIFPVLQAIVGNLFDPKDIYQ